MTRLVSDIPAVMGLEQWFEGHICVLVFSETTLIELCHQSTEVVGVYHVDPSEQYLCFKAQCRFLPYCCIISVIE